MSKPGYLGHTAGDNPSMQKLQLSSQVLGHLGSGDGKTWGEAQPQALRNFASRREVNTELRFTESVVT